MAITEEQFAQAEKQGEEARQAGYAIKARYDRRAHRVVVALNTGVHVTFPTHLAQGLDNATPDALSEIEISPSGLGLHWPQLDADLSVPGLLQGHFGSRSWMAAQMGGKGGQSRSAAKQAAARANGLKGGRPRKMARP
ncbi:hypothetical protein AA13595_3062 [Gluconacetobacter johannae DSM 13595]|uniref:DUF2442 domain-containing protein n=1 Tax=Gluconacetobacter johannae TaxID=112140 RepID=A0A7W4J8J6_9PROT|nr:DUF2442 domain-containing protein [Gluconacetobacter johannae]MBB2176649.1 DUF2442 domain-containing protein [Gluconacetobacter johannae]GBQ91212.1 hypothetical protein AA13595_3062 [Gluconacetobacter johannae DSM 13595]